MHWHNIDKIGGQIVTYGSYMLGILHQGADIDALCIAPQHITRLEHMIDALICIYFSIEFLFSDKNILVPFFPS